ncbi:MAG: hypothetical protein Q4E45_09690 [Eubacteriales bacterium]|nr:hypothetical protein [Eubacteriales bacterium]
MNNKLPRLIAMIVALIAIVGFFLPFISATQDYRDYMSDQVDDKPFDGVDITVGEIMDMSLFKYARVYFQGGEAFFGSGGMGTFYGVLMCLIPGLALLVMLAAWRGKPVLTLILDLLMGGAFYIVNWDFVDRGIMPSGDRVWAIAHHLYYPLAAIIAACAIWMFIVRRRTKDTADLPQSRP